MLTLHILAMAFSIATVFRADSDAVRWLLGKRLVLDARSVRRSHWFIWAGLVTLIISGAILSYPMLPYLLRQPLFIMKLLFVAVLITNAVLIGRFSHIAIERPFMEIPWDQKVPLLLIGAISSISWIGALVLALELFK